MIKNENSKNPKAVIIWRGFCYVSNKVTNKVTDKMLGKDRANRVIEQNRHSDARLARAKKSRQGPYSINHALNLALVLCLAIASPLQGFAQPDSVSNAPTSSTSSKNTLASARELLQKMDRAFTEINYDGVFSYYSGDELASLRVIHKRVDGVQRERLVHLNGAPRDIIRHGDEVICIVQPGDDLLALADSIPSGPFARSFVRGFDGLGDSYKIIRAGTGRIANRRAIELSILPKDEHRYGYRLWLDEVSHLLLRSELVDQSNKRLEIFQFTHLAIGDAVKTADLEPSSVGEAVSHLTLSPSPNSEDGVDKDNQSKMRNSTPGWITTWIPPGFAMAAADKRHKPDHMVTNMIYSDGLAAFSIFIEPMPSIGAANMTSQQGGTVAVTRQLVTGGDAHLVTLVGEVPVATANKIVTSLERSHP